MIPEVDGDSTPLSQQLLCVLLVVCRLWASLRPTHLKDWVQGWVPQSACQLRRGFSTSLDIEEVLSGAGGEINCMSWLLML